jgi:hypothetical protein
VVTRDKLLGIGPVGVDQLEQASQARHADQGSAALCAAERAAIQSRRDRYALVRASDENLFGLALSGGGIRSATFALGVLQAMAARDLLKHVDYLSTVSGGGYIGSSLLWWLSGLSGRTFGVRPWADGVPQNERFPYGSDDPSAWRDRAGQADGPRLLRNLKENGNYLTPGKGINIMSLIAVVLRGVVLNLLFWIPLVTVLLGVLHVVGGYKLGLGLAIALVLVFVVAALGYSLATGHASLARRLARISHREQVHRGSERGKDLLRQSLNPLQRIPRCRHSVAATCSVMKWSRAARWSRRSTVARSPPMPGRCCSARPTGRLA